MTYEISIDEIFQTIRHLQTQHPDEWVNRVRNQLNEFMVIDDAFAPCRFIAHAREVTEIDPKKTPFQKDTLDGILNTLSHNGYSEIKLGTDQYDSLFIAYLRYYKSFKKTPRKGWEEKRKNYSANGRYRFWIKTKAHPTVAPEDLTQDHIINAMDRFGNGEEPDGFKKPRGWHVIHPNTKEAFPLKGVYGLATGLSCSHGKTDNFKTGDAIQKLKKLDFECIDIRKNLLDEELQQGLERSRNDTSEARRERLRSAPHKPAKIIQTVVRFQRNPDVIAERLHMAQGTCEHCGNKAPFIRTSDNTPFLEVHHVIFLADDGEDTVENTRALCPNCHRKAHYG